MIIIEYPDASKIYHLGDGKLIGVDQTNRTEDRTCLCFVKYNKDEKMFIKKIKYIEKQKDIDKYINENLAKIYSVFGVSDLD